MQKEIFMKPLVTSAFLTLACAIPAWANVGIKEVNSDYELRGVTTSEIHENILKNAPREEGNIVDAETKERVTFTLGYETKDGTCRIASDQVKLEIISTFPRWVDQERATNEARKAWESYSNALRGHEDGHKAIALKAANAVDTLIHVKQGASTCASIEAKIAKAADKINTIALSEQESFDKNAPNIDIEEN
jgi:predicted secreted Zn-dependent protease